MERQIHNALEARFEKLAPTELKNVEVPMDLFRIVLPWERQKSAVRGQKSEIEGVRSIRNAENRALIGGRVVLLLIGIGWWWTTLPHKNPVAASPSTGSGADAKYSRKKHRGVAL